MLFNSAVVLIFIWISIQNVKTECGKSTVQPSLASKSRIVGGNTAIPHSWPWQVFFSYHTKADATTRGCGGSLLPVAKTPGYSDIVLTAAHCVLDTKNNFAKNDPKDYFVFVGEHDIGGDQTIVRRAIGLQSYITEPNYKGDSNDIAVVKLAKPVKFGPAIQPVCLPEQGQQVSNASDCYATGWGALSHGGSTPNLLQQTKLPILPVDYCSSTIPQYNPQTMICAGYKEGGKSTCQGDSGGPLVCKEKNGWTVYGITSMGVGCGLAGHPMQFVRVNSYNFWINEQIQKLTA